MNYNWILDFHSPFYKIRDCLKQYLELLKKPEKKIKAEILRSLFLLMKDSGFRNCPEIVLEELNKLRTDKDYSCIRIIDILELLLDSSNQYLYPETFERIFQENLLISDNPSKEFNVFKLSYHIVKNFNNEVFPGKFEMLKRLSEEMKIQQGDILLSQNLNDEILFLMGNIPDFSMLKYCEFLGISYLEKFENVQWKQFPSMYLSCQLKEFIQTLKENEIEFSLEFQITEGNLYLIQLEFSEEIQKKNIKPDFRCIMKASEITIPLPSSEQEYLFFEFQKKKMAIEMELIESIDFSGKDKSRKEICIRGNHFLFADKIIGTSLGLVSYSKEKAEIISNQKKYHLAGIYV